MTQDTRRSEIDEAAGQVNTIDRMSIGPYIKPTRAS